MYFKPRIFISSTFDLLDTRKKIESFFLSVGAEVMLYERNLTPSINPASYKLDVREADFVIFIFHEKYGTKTNSGKSGTHEEWEIVLNSKIPSHVYIKIGKNKVKKLDRFISDNVNKKQISYYFYNDLNDLLRQIKKTTFTIARDTTIHKINELGVEDNVIRKMAFNHDYYKNKKFIKGFEEIIKLNNDGFASLIETTIIHEFISFWDYQYDWNNLIYIDNKANELFKLLLSSYREFIRYQSYHFTTRDHRDILLESINLKLSVSYLTPSLPDDVKKQEEFLEKLLKAYSSYKDYVFDYKKNFDINF